MSGFHGTPYRSRHEFRAAIGNDELDVKIRSADRRLCLTMTSNGSDPLHLFVAGLSYKTAPVEIREQLAFEPSRLRCHGCRLKLRGGLAELVIVSTCNRVEIYGVSARPAPSAARLFQELAGVEGDFDSYLYLREGREAARHLFEVVSGLDSMVIGETEIAGQVKQAYQAAQSAGLTGRITNRLFQTAFQTAKQVRTETGIGRGATSVGSVAVELAERIFDRDLADKTVMIVGAGKMGEACVRHLAKKGARSILVLNRSPEKAEALANEFHGRAGALDGLRPALVDADIVVTSTGSPRAILTQADLESVMPARRNRPLFIIDIAVPRDVAAEVQTVPNVYLYNVDHLEQIVNENVRLRERELARCREIIHESASAVMVRFTPRAAAHSALARDWSFAPAAATPEPV